MELTNNPRVYFDPVSHSYTNERGVLLEGVTGLLRKHNLSPDYSGIPEKVLNEAARKGTALHERIEAYDNKEVIFADEFIDSYREVCSANNLRFICNELLISDEELVASKIDGVYEGTTQNSVVLIDYKSTQQIHWRSLSWQLSIYRTLFERQFPGIRVEGLYVLWIDKKLERCKGLFPVAPVSGEEVDALLNCERQGLIYVDENDTPDLEEVLSPEDAQLLTEHASKIAELETTLKVLKEADEAIQAKLLDYMESNNIDSISCPGGTFTRRKATTKTAVDAKLLKEKFPAVYSKVLKTSAVKGSITYNPNKE